ncbi:MAG: isopentenyl-diphosphate Delta-isomerase [Candidatus Aenigmarchaeota archaeon]|nr:isopentenyl-diphosphate Delta-isomerase [Candidatus Aenigmarchaeota archaeon]
MPEKLILVDKKDKKIGSAEKMEVHTKGALHRAFSIIIFNSKGQMLIHKRAKTKYHCGGLLTNACCSHPLVGESTEKAAHRRLTEEMGFDCKLKEVTSFIYKAEFDNGLTENEFDHVFVGFYDGKIKPDKKEVDEFKFIDSNELKKDIKMHPEKYTPWFRIIMEKNIAFGL